MPRKYTHGRDIPDPNPSGVCMCGCGKPAPISDRTSSAKGVVKGKPRRFLFNHGPSRASRLATAKKYGRNPGISRRDETAQIIKEAKRLGCAVCGFDVSIALDFHHLNPKEKRMDIGWGSTHATPDEVQAEISKCVVLCANCHRMLHAGMIGLP